MVWREREEGDGRKARRGFREEHGVWAMRDKDRVRESQTARDT